jgi:hypothetical protein
VLIDEQVAPNHPSPSVIRGILGQECESLRDRRRL